MTFEKEYFKLAKMCAKYQHVIDIIDNKIIGTPNSTHDSMIKDIINKLYGDLKRIT